MAGFHFLGRKGDRGIAAIPEVAGSGARRRSVDDLELGELRQTLFGELRADARLLGAAEGDMRGHVEMLVDPDRAGLDLLCDLVSALGVRRPDRSAEAVGRRVGAA